MRASWQWFFLFWTMVALMSGPISVLRELIALCRGDERPRAQYWRWVWIAFVVSAFISWFGLNSQLRTANNAIAEKDRALVDLSKPKLQGHIDQISIGPMGEYPTVVLLWVSIHNLGADSIADSYALQATLPDGSHIDLTQATVPPHIVLRQWALQMDTNQGTLYDKTYEQPIPRGGSRNGILFFSANVSPEVLKQRSTTFRLTFKDIQERVNAASYTIEGISGKPKYIPGTPKFSPLKPETR